MKLLNLEISSEELLKALLPTEEERRAFLAEHFPARKAVFSVDEACEYVGLGRTKLYESDIPFKNLQGCRRYTRKALDEYLANLPDNTGAIRARVVRRKPAA